MTHQTSPPAGASGIVPAPLLDAASGPEEVADAEVVRPACRRMSESAARLVDEVLPRVPVRQCVLSLPHRLRYLLTWDHGLARAVLGVSARVLLGFQRHRARRFGVRDGRSGCVTVIQRFGGGLNLNLHFYRIVRTVTQPDLRC